MAVAVLDIGLCICIVVCCVSGGVGSNNTVHYTLLQCTATRTVENRKKNNEAFWLFTCQKTLLAAMFASNR